MILDYVKHNFSCILGKSLINRKYQLHSRPVRLQFTATASVKYTDDMYNSNTQPPQVPSTLATCETPIHSNHKHQVHTRPVRHQFTATASTKYTRGMCDINSLPLISGDIH